MAFRLRVWCWRFLTVERFRVEGSFRDWVCAVWCLGWEIQGFW